MTGVMVLRRVHTFPSFPPLAGSQSTEAHSAASVTSLSPFWVCSELMSWSLKYEQLGKRGH